MRLVILSKCTGSFFHLVLQQTSSSLCFLILYFSLSVAHAFVVCLILRPSASGTKPLERVNTVEASFGYPSSCASSVIIIIIIMIIITSSKEQFYCTRGTKTNAILILNLLRLQGKQYLTMPCRCPGITPRRLTPTDSKGHQGHSRGDFEIVSVWRFFALPSGKDR